MDSEKGKFQYAALRFLYDNELVQDVQLINNLKLNLLSISKYIREVEILTYQQKRQMHVYLEVSAWGKYWFSKQIEQTALDILKQLLPRYNFRVSLDRKVFDLAVQKAQKVLIGALEKKDEETNTNNSSSSTNDRSQR